MTRDELGDVVALEIGAMNDMIAARYTLAAAALEEAARRLEEASGDTETPGAAEPLDEDDVMRIVPEIIQFQLDALGRVDAGAPASLPSHRAVLRRLAELSLQYERDGEPSLAEALRFDAGLSEEEIGVLRAGLSELLEEGDFLELAAAGTDFFVRFTNFDGELLLDLPAGDLPREARERALSCFSCHHVRRPEWREAILADVFDFQVLLGTDVDAAARLAPDLLRAVDLSGTRHTLEIRTE